jgi:hypothetical protein
LRNLPTDRTLIVRSFRDLFVLRRLRDAGIVVGLKGDPHGAGNTTEEGIYETASRNMGGSNNRCDWRGSRKRLDARARFHRHEVKRKGAELKKLVAARKKDDSEPTWREGSLQTQIREHDERSDFLAFVRDYLVRDVTYRLSRTELRLLDLTPQLV